MNDVKKQHITRLHDKLPHIVTGLAIFRLYTFSLICSRLRTEIGSMGGSWQLLNSLVIKAVCIRPIFSMRYHNLSGTVVHLLEWPNLVHCSNPGHQTKGHHVPLGLCGREGSGPALGGVPALCFELFFLLLWLV